MYMCMTFRRKAYFYNFVAKLNLKAIVENGSEIKVLSKYKNAKGSFRYIFSKMNSSCMVNNY